MMIRHIITFLALTFIGSTLIFAQENDGVGIGTSEIADDAILEIKSSNKGVLVPSWNNLTDPTNATEATGLLVFYEGDNSFYIWDGGDWKKVLREDGSAKVSSLQSTSTITAASSISGQSISASNNITATNTVSGNNISASNNLSAVETISGKNLSVSQDIEGRDITASGEFIGNGVVPLGGILMWSGAIGDVPSNFEICDGGSANGITIPDLVDKFIMSASSASSTSGLVALDNSGGGEYLVNSNCSEYEYLYSGTYVNTCDSSYPTRSFSYVAASSFGHAAILASGCSSAQPTGTPSTTPNPNYNKTKESCRVAAAYYNLAFIIRVR